MLVCAGGPRRQQRVQAFELGSVQPILPLHERAIGNVSVLPRCSFGRGGRAAVAPVQTDEVLRLEEGGNFLLLIRAFDNMRDNDDV